jgi:hypothetical protein
MGRGLDGGRTGREDLPRRWYALSLPDLCQYADQMKQPMSVEDFIRTFKAARKVYHKRAIWCERWSRGEVAWRED